MANCFLVKPMTVKHRLWERFATVSVLNIEHSEDPLGSRVEELSDQNLSDHTSGILQDLECEEMV